jgi:hypothetical protein
MSPSPNAMTDGTTYTPGYVAHKRAMFFAGLLLAAFGAFELRTPLRLTLFGGRAKAEAVRVVKEKPGLPPIVMTNDAQVRAQLEPHDRTFVFWNDFQFVATGGKLISVRAGVGSQLKPLYSVTDADGLPTTDLIFYDPANPEQAIFPLIISTWLAPMVLLLVGLITAIIGATLLYWARKPIEVPHIPAGRTAPPIGKKS